MLLLFIQVILRELSFDLFIFTGDLPLQQCTVPIQQINSLIRIRLALFIF